MYVDICIQVLYVYIYIYIYICIGAITAAGLRAKTRRPSPRSTPDSPTNIIPTKIA